MRRKVMLACRNHQAADRRAAACLFVFDRLSYALIGESDVGGSYPFSSLTNCGPDCLAWRDAESIYLLRLSSLTLSEPPPPARAAEEHANTTNANTANGR